MNILPLPGQCLVEILPYDRSVGSVIIPENCTMKDIIGKLPPLRGIVIRMGRWPQKPNGLSVLPEFSPGDQVLVSPYIGTKLKWVGEKFRVVPIKDVLAILK